MLSCEVWLCKVLLHQGGAGVRRLDELNDKAHAAVLAKIVNGELAVLQDGAIVEPVQSYATELDAAAAREQKLVDEPGTDWRVVITMAVGA